MGIFDELLTETTSSAYSKPLDKVDASIGLLFLAGYADGNYSEAEQEKVADQIVSIKGFYQRCISHLFEGRTYSQQLSKDLMQKIEAYGFERCIEIYAQAIPDEWKKTIYVHLVELLYVDGSPNSQNIHMMELTYQALNLPADDALEIARVIGYKHALDS